MSVTGIEKLEFGVDDLTHCAGLCVILARRATPAASVYHLKRRAGGAEPDP